ncbi:hypothetical protein ATANTOWER_009854 [Ataeniobius toweri]|uniref:Uncharacterized protein n=1 Tax=Ataeniobius toweri TaxID=208326 RepID=A0ABU7CBD1_9TELE|nr:hypothetical protein [Ataeniobius toweri]
MSKNIAAPLRHHYGDTDDSEEESVSSKRHGFHHWAAATNTIPHFIMMISCLASIGSQTTKHITWNILGHMFSDNVVKMINWKRDEK